MDYIDPLVAIPVAIVLWAMYWLADAKERRAAKKRRSTWI